MFNFPVYILQYQLGKAISPSSKWLTLLIQNPEIQTMNNNNTMRVQSFASPISSQPNIITWQQTLETSAAVISKAIKTSKTTGNPLFIKWPANFPPEMVDAIALRVLSNQQPHPRTTTTHSIQNTSPSTSHITSRLHSQNVHPKSNLNSPPTQMQYVDQPINPPPMTTRPSPQYEPTLPNESNNNLQNQTPLPPFIQFFREKIQATAEAALQKSNQQSDS